MAPIIIDTIIPSISSEYSPLVTSITIIPREKTDLENLTIDQIKNMNHKVLRNLLVQFKNQLKVLELLLINNISDKNVENVEDILKLESSIQHIRELTEEIYRTLPVLQPLDPIE